MAKNAVKTENWTEKIRDLIKSGDGKNKFCFDCEQRGVTFVNCTIGSFVCMACSGIL